MPLCNACLYWEFYVETNYEEYGECTIDDDDRDEEGRLPLKKWGDACCYGREKPKKRRPGNLLGSHRGYQRSPCSEGSR